MHTFFHHIPANVAPFLLLALAAATALGHAGAPETALAMAAIALIWLWSNWRQRRALRHIVCGADLLRGQDYASRLRKVGNPEIDSIVDLFNSLMKRLKDEHLKLSERHNFLSMLIEASPMAIEIYDYDRTTVTLANPAARNIVTSELRRAIANMDLGENRIIRLSGSKIFKCSLLTFREDGFLRPFLMVEPLTDEIRRVEKDSFEKIIRLISHEVNNTISGVITLSDTLVEAEKMRPDGGDPDTVAALESCTMRSRSLSRFIKDYVDLVKMPRPKIVEVCVADMLKGIHPFLKQIIIPGQQQLTDLTLDISSGAGRLTAWLDPTLFEQAVVNIVKNAIESCAAHGSGNVTLSLTEGPEAESLQLTVTDSGGGIDPGVAGNLFTPFFSTKSGGRGLGLMFIGEVLDRHNFAYSLATSPDDGLTRFKIIIGRHAANNNA